MELDHEQRKVSFYPSEFNSWNNAAPQVSRYYVMDKDGYAYLDINAIGEDLDKLSGDDCACSGPGCKCRPAGNVGGADPYTEAISVGLKGLGDFAQAFKKGEKAQELRQKLKAYKEQCPKKPFLRITKKQKAQYEAHTRCIAEVTQREQELEREAIRAGQRQESEPAAKADKDNTALYWGIGIGGFLLVLLVVIMILFMRSQRKKATKTE
ncbi:MAG: hypothetical protein V4721_16525 [Bacteroidota bacterium]